MSLDDDIEDDQPSPKKIVPHPHDAFFKAILSNREATLQFLKLCLPAELLQDDTIVDLEYLPTSFISPQLEGSHADAIFKVTLKHKGDIFFIVSVEHQQHPDRTIPIRLEAYRVDLQRYHLKQAKPPPTGDHDFPPVLSMIYYTGTQQPYPYSMHIRDMYPDNIATELMFQQPYRLVSMLDLDIENPLDMPHFAMYNLVTRCLVLDKLSELLDGLKYLHDHADIPLDIRTSTWHYIGICLGEKQKGFFESLIKQLPKYGDDMVSLAESWMREGMEIGREAGREEGRAEGLEKGIEVGAVQTVLITAKKMLQLSLDLKLVAQVTGLSEAKLEELKKSLS